MSVTGLDRVREMLAEYLQSQGLHAVTAWSEGARKRHEKPVVAVSLKESRGNGAGFQNYLGERYNEEAGRWEELYGKKLELTFGLDLYGGVEQGAAGCQSEFNALADAFSAGGPEGMRLGMLSCGETEFDQETGMFHCPAELKASAWMYAVAAEDGGMLLDFTVRGAWK